MSSHSLARRFVEEVLGAGRVDLIPALTTPTYVDHALPPGVTPAQSIAGFRAAFPDARFTLDDTVAEGDRVVARWSMAGTHAGEFFGMRPTGAKVQMQGISMYRVEDGRLAEGWVQYDTFGLVRQLQAAGA